MKRRMLCLLCLLLAIHATAFAQQAAIIEKTEISGISEDKLSSALRADLQKLAGQVYDANAAAEIAERIQAELPEYVATPTTSPGTQADRVRLIFAVAHNINAKYIVEAVSYDNIDKSKLSDGLRADIDKMIGHPVNDVEADRIRDLMAKEVKSLRVRRYVQKGNDPQHVRIIYQAIWTNSAGWNFHGPGYHSRQKFSGTLAATYTFIDRTGIEVAAVNNADLLVERYAGFQYGYWVGYKRVRFDIKYSSYRSQWSTGSLQAAANSPVSPLYRLRDTIAPTVNLTFSGKVSATIGFLATQLQYQTPASHFESIRTATGKLDYFAGRINSGIGIDGSYDIHVAGNALGGASTYTRQLWNQSFSRAYYQHSPPTISDFLDTPHWMARLQLGRITGGAPMFERFSLGNIETLPGWNKYDISPLGADRMAYTSASYSNRIGRIMFDAGALWNGGQPKVLRKSVGGSVKLGTLLDLPGPFRGILNFLSPTIGIPIRGSHVRPIFSIGSGN